MTDNDKAATFIGWEPFVRAGDPIPEWGDKHGNRSPDMADPRNYMKALEAVTKSQRFWGISIRLDFQSNECFFEEVPMPTKRPGRNIYCEGETLAKAITKALATLYNEQRLDGV